MGFGEEPYSGEGRESIRTPLPFTLPLIQILTNPASPTICLFPYLLYFQEENEKKRRGENKDKLPRKKEGRENEEEKKTTKRNCKKEYQSFQA